MVEDERERRSGPAGDSAARIGHKIRHTIGAVTAWFTVVLCAGCRHAAAQLACRTMRGGWIIGIDQGSIHGGGKLMWHSGARMSPRRGWRSALVVSTFVTLAMIVGGAGGRANGSVTTLKTYSVPGLYNWKVPAGVTSVTFTVYGASGGSVVSGGVLYALGGPGGEARASFTVKPGWKFEIAVGGQGGTGTGSAAGGGGVNGGGAGFPPGNGVFGGGGGGGESAVFRGYSGLVCTGSVLTCPLQSRIVAGGGGGGGIATSTTSADGGAGGGGLGSPGDGPLSMSGGGGDQEGGGQAGYGGSQSSVGTFGAGGLGGGGGGWYGGGGAGIDPNVAGPGVYGPGGGSGFFSGLALSGSFPGGTHSGNGLVIIKTG